MPRGKPRARPAQDQPEPDRAREMSVRRVAARQGYKAAKIRRYDPAALDYGRWLLTDPDGELVISKMVRGIQVGASIDEVEKFLGIAPPDGEQAPFPRHAARCD